MGKIAAMLKRQSYTTIPVLRKRRWQLAQTIN
jgi:hypothetical protein